jgi:hypothetical protein
MRAGPPRQEESQPRLGAVTWVQNTLLPSVPSAAEDPATESVRRAPASRSRCRCPPRAGGRRWRGVRQRSIVTSPRLVVTRNVVSGSVPVYADGRGGKRRDSPIPRFTERDAADGTRASALRVGRIPRRAPDSLPRGAAAVNFGRPLADLTVRPEWRRPRPQGHARRVPWPLPRPVRWSR